jgi:cytochrome c biogenesis protein CcmG/thiol:disulfide interchange protein DsbE
VALAPPAEVPVAGRGRRPRLVLWVSLPVGLVVAVLVAVFAVAGKPADTSRLVGSPAPPLAGSSLSGGGRVSLAAYAGRWVLVDFGASWCVACREELPYLKAFAATASRHDAVLLTVEEDPSDGPALARYMAANHADWPVVQDPTAQVSYAVTGIPDIFLVDPEGIVVGYYPSGIDPARLDDAITAAISGGAT